MRLLIVTPDIHGPIRNGGIGTAFGALAGWAAVAGFQVTVAYALGDYSEDGPIGKWVDHYAQRGVRLIPIDDEALGPLPILDAPHYRRLAWIVHTWLSRHQDEWDVVVFPEWMGLAFYALLAKRQGLHYRDLTMIVNTHSPEAWAMEGNRRLPDRLDEVERDFLERESVRMADRVVSPSSYLLDWMRQRHWALTPGRCEVVPNLMPENGQDAALAHGAVRRMHRVVFFGRLEPRKGLNLFCDAIDRLDRDERCALGSITFLGKAVLSGDFESNAYIADRTRGWGLAVDVVTDRNRDEALIELRQPGTLAVIPSLVENSPYTVLECLREGVTFLATEVGGIPEMLEPADHATHLFEPNPRALAARLGAVYRVGLAPARSAWTETQARSRWAGLLAECRQPTTTAATAGRDDPLVSVCLVHYNRPRLLRQALDSLRAQTYQNLEVVLVDDGSPGTETQECLEELGPEFERRGWRIVLQENSYLGAARNNAARHARGTYLIFMDDDNVALPQMVETFARAAVHGGADVLTSVMMPFTSETPPQNPGRLWITLGGALGVGLFRNTFGDANALWTREAFERVGGYTTDYGVGHEDWELFAEAMLSGLRLELIPEPLYWYRVNPGGMLRAGHRIANHARSARPFLKHDPLGLGMALAYAHSLQIAQEHRPTTPSRLGLRALVRLAWRALRLARDASLRAQFIGVWRNEGVRTAVRRALSKAQVRTSL